MSRHLARTLPFMLPLAVAAAIALPAHAAEKRFGVAGFDRVSVGGSDDVTIRQGSGFAVVATGAQADLDKLTISVDGGVLKIGRKSSWMSWGTTKGVKIAVTMPALHGLSLSGSANVDADKGDGDTFALALSGSGNLAIAALNARTVNAALAGSGNLSAGGRCGALTLKLAGSGDAMLGNLACTNAAISVAGSGDVAARASGQADVRIAGSGDVTVTGGARCTSRVAGSGDVRCS